MIRNRDEPPPHRRLPPLLLRPPVATDGRAVHALVASCQPLDPNSLYCNLLQCSHFAPTCCIAELHGRAVGFVSGYLHPQNPDVLFIWQVAVAAEARGRGLGRQMLHELIARPACARVTTMHTTITPSNRASWALFDSFARDLGAPLRSSEYFDRVAHLDGRHETEMLVAIGPFADRDMRSTARTRRTA
ncbi:MAG: diaminobutyrate acetyltransferase [Gammaproteobacteria bacterium]